MTKGLHGEAPQNCQSKAQKLERGVHLTNEIRQETNKLGVKIEEEVVTRKGPVAIPETSPKTPYEVRSSATAETVHRSSMMHMTVELRYFP